MSNNFQPSQHTQLTRLKVVAAIPCFNTEHSITDIVKRTRRYVDQVIVIDDGSHDGTAEAVRTAGALVISHDGNLGKGAAMKTAVRNIDADAVIFLDGDGQHEPEDISKIIAPILQDKADLVISSRCLPESKVSISPFTRRFANNVVSLIISMTISFLLPLATSLNHLTHPKSPRVNSQTLNYQLLTDDCQLPTIGDYQLVLK